MFKLLYALEQELPASNELGFHYTDFQSAKLILGSLGIRASSEGQLGGGVSVCLATPVDFGWEKWGGERFSKTNGVELWGSKWYEVMPGPRPEGEPADWGAWSKKLEVLLILRIPATENRDSRRIVPARPNVYIIPHSDCVPGLDGDAASYLSNTKIEKVLILKPPAEGSDGRLIDLVDLVQ